MYILLVSLGCYGAVSVLLDGADLSSKSYSAYNAEYIPKFFTLAPTLAKLRRKPLPQCLSARYFTNTLIFTVDHYRCSCSLVVTLAAFAFARLEFRGKSLAFTLLLSLMMIPNELVIITNFVTITNLGLRNTFTGLISALGHVGVLYLPAEGKLRAGTR